jgi:hypothetical protein
MENQERIVKTEEVRVLDNGQNMNDPIIMVAFCCGGLIIPYRMI